MSRARVVIVALSLAAAPAGTTLAAAAVAGSDIPPEPGEKWKVTTSIKAMGMNMPGITVQMCAPKNADQAPVETDPSCQIVDRKRIGNKETVQMRCTGEDKMEGALEIEHLSSDHYRGRMLMKTADGTMEMNYEGKKIGGDCDAAEIKRKVARFQAGAAKQQSRATADIARQCADAAKDNAWSAFLGSGAMCTDPKDKQVFCGGAQTHKGFLGLSRHQRLAEQTRERGQDVLTQTAAACGFSAGTVRSGLCASAESKNQWDYIAGECPTIAEPLAKRECAGRNYSSNQVARKYREFCSAYASEQSVTTLGPDGDDAPAEEPPAKPEGVKGMLKGVGKLRGLFGG